MRGAYFTFVSPRCFHILRQSHAVGGFVKLNPIISQHLPCSFKIGAGVIPRHDVVLCKAVGINRNANLSHIGFQSLGAIRRAICVLVAKIMPRPKSILGSDLLNVFSKPHCQL